MKYVITGGTGLVGQRLTQILAKEGHEIVILSRSKKSHTNAVKYYQWDIEKGIIENGALENTDVLIHLAGAGVADEKWTEERKKEIIESRVAPLDLLEREYLKLGQKPKKIVSASAIGYYGFDTGEALQTEESKAGKDYLSKVVIEWEGAVEKMAQKLHCESAMIRIGIVLSTQGGALPQLALPVKLGMGSAIGDGQQWLSWIHIDDLCQIFKTASENPQMTGPLNAAAPTPLRNTDFVKVLGKVLKRPIWAPKVPGFVLKIMLGERAQMVLGGNKVSCQKLLDNGFKFDYPEAEAALKQLYS